MACGGWKPSPQDISISKASPLPGWGLWLFRVSVPQRLYILMTGDSHRASQPERSMSAEPYR